MIFIKVQILVHFVIEYHIIIIILQIIILFILKMFIILFSLCLLCPSFCILLQLSINYFTKLWRYEREWAERASWDVFSRFLVVFAEIYWANTGLFGRRVIRTNCCLLVLLVLASHLSVHFNSKLPTDKVRDMTPSHQLIGILSPYLAGSVTLWH